MAKNPKHMTKVLIKNDFPITHIPQIVNDQFGLKEKSEVMSYNKAVKLKYAMRFGK